VTILASSLGRRTLEAQIHVHNDEVVSGIAITYMDGLSGLKWNTACNRSSQGSRRRVSFCLCRSHVRQVRGCATVIIHQAMILRYYKLEVKQRSLRIEFANAGGNSTGTPRCDRRSLFYPRQSEQPYQLQVNLPLFTDPNSARCGILSSSHTSLSQPQHIIAANNILKPTSWSFNTRSSSPHALVRLVADPKALITSNGCRQVLPLSTVNRMQSWSTVS
jgi:hypothetical protein